MDVTPENQNLDTVFSSSTYYIDFYQRQYKWQAQPVNILLEDIFYKFNQEYRQYKDSSSTPEKMVNSFAWYYLNTYVTDVIADKI